MWSVLVNSPFVPEIAIIDEEIPIYMQPFIWDLAKQLGAGLFFVVNGVRYTASDS